MRVVAVRSLGSALLVVGRNWKSEKRRWAHLLAEKLLETVLLLLGPPLIACGFRCFLVFEVGNGVDNGTQTPILRWPRASIGMQLFSVVTQIFRLVARF